MSRDGRSVPISTKVSPATAEAIEKARGALTRSAWLAQVAEAAACGGTTVVSIAPTTPEDLARNVARVVVQVQPPEPEPTGPPAKVVQIGTGKASSKAGHPSNSQVTPSSKGKLSRPDPDQCGHPRGDYVNRGYATFCGLCGAKVR